MKVYHLPRLRCALLGLLPKTEAEARHYRAQRLRQQRVVGRSSPRQLERRHSR